MNMSLIQTERLDATMQSMFNKHCVGYEGSEFTVHDKNGDSYTVHTIIVCTKCPEFQKALLNGEQSIHLENEKDIVEGFLRLLYGFQLQLTPDKIFDIWNLSIYCNYDKATLLRDVLLQNIAQLETKEKISLLSNVNISRADVIKKLSLKDIRIMSKEISDPEILQMFVEETIVRYSIDTNSLKQHNTLLDSQLKKIKSDIQSKKSQSGAGLFGAGLFNADPAGGFGGFGGFGGK